MLLMTLFSTLFCWRQTNRGANVWFVWRVSLSYDKKTTSSEWSHCGRCSSSGVDVWALVYTSDRGSVGNETIMGFDLRTHCRASSQILYCLASKSTTLYCVEADTEMPWLTGVSPSPVPCHFATPNIKTVCWYWSSTYSTCPSQCVVSQEGNQEVWRLKEDKVIDSSRSRQQHCRRCVDSSRRVLTQQRREGNSSNGSSTQKNTFWYFLHCHSRT